MTIPSLDSSSQSGTPGNQPGSSDGQNVQPGSESFTLTKAQWDELQGKIQTIERTAQGDKDRAVRKTNERLDALSNQLQPLLERALQHTASGKSAAEALSLVQSENEENQTKQALAEFAAAWKSGKLPEGFGVGSTQAQGVDVGQVLAEYRLDPKDPFVAGKLAGQKFTTTEQAELFAARILRDSLNNQTNPAQQSAVPGAAAQSAGSVQDKINRLSELQTTDPLKFQKEIKTLTAELDALNWGMT